jgi:hypothetical protein
MTKCPIITNNKCRSRSIFKFRIKKNYFITNITINIYCYTKAQCIIIFIFTRLKWVIFMLISEWIVKHTFNTPFEQIFHQWYVVTTPNWHRKTNKLWCFFFTNLTKNQDKKRVGQLPTYNTIMFNPFRTKESIIVLKMSSCAIGTR